MIRNTLWRVHMNMKEEQKSELPLRSICFPFLYATRLVMVVHFWRDCGTICYASLLPLRPGCQQYFKSVAGAKPDTLALKHESRIFRSAIQHYMMEQVRLCAVWPFENWPALLRNTYKAGRVIGISHYPAYESGCLRETSRCAFFQRPLRVYDLLWNFASSPLSAAARNYSKAFFARSPRPRPQIECYFPPSSAVLKAFSDVICCRSASRTNQPPSAE